MSKIPWSGKNCILCLKEEPLTREHIIPAQIGGVLWARFLCKACNSYLGAEVEAAVRKDPSIRLAVENLQGELPGLADALSEGLPYVGTSEGGTVRMIGRAGELRVQGGTQQDGSLILSPNSSREHIRAEARRRGMAPADIDAILERFDELPQNMRTELMPGYEVINWRVDEIRPALDGPMLSERVLLKIAYEFLACHLGKSILDNAEQLNNWRTALLGESLHSVRVESLTSGRYRPIHGLALEDEGHSIIHICLFGWIRYRVHLLDLCISPPYFSYTCNLTEGTDHCQIVGSEPELRNPQ